MGIGLETRREVEAPSPGLLKSGLGRMSLLAWAQRLTIEKLK
ncbi:MAG: hypothetical protein QXG12_06570 [Thermoproteota archaeon]